MPNFSSSVSTILLLLRYGRIFDSWEVNIIVVSISFYIIFYTLYDKFLCVLKSLIVIGFFQALIDGTTGSPFAQIVLVISNKEDAYGIQRAKKANINYKIVKHDLYSSRKQFEEVIDKYLIESSIDIICLAGFMRILTGWFVNRWRGKLLNLHPSLLPAFKGAHAVRDALNAQVRVTGVTVHFVEVSFNLVSEDI